MQSFFAMGGYASYVWPSYALFLVVLLGGWGHAIWRGRRIRNLISQELLEPTE